MAVLNSSLSCHLLLGVFPDYHRHCRFPSVSSCIPLLLWRHTAPPHAAAHVCLLKAAAWPHLTLSMVPSSQRMLSKMHRPAHLNLQIPRQANPGGAAVPKTRTFRAQAHLIHPQLRALSACTRPLLVPEQTGRQQLGLTMLGDTLWMPMGLLSQCTLGQEEWGPQGRRGAQSSTGARS